MCLESSSRFSTFVADSLPPAQGLGGPALNRAQATPPASAGGHNNTTRTRVHLWNLEAKYLCAIVGTCTTISEMRKLAIKSQIDSPGQYSDYQLHNIFVNAAHDGSRPGRLLEKLLQQKFRTTIARYRVTPESEFGALWENALKGGDVAGSYYTLLTNSRTPAVVQEKAVGDIHMLSHISGASCRIDLKQLPELKKKNRELTAHVNRLNLNHRKAIQGWEKKQVILQKNCAELKSHLARQRVPDIDLSTEQRELTRLRKKNSVLSNLVDRLRQEKNQFARQVSDLQRHALVPQNGAQGADPAVFANKPVDPIPRESGASDIGHASGSRPELNLNGKKVLYVGGRYRQAPHFRELVERRNGCLFYHDGGREDGDKRLAAILSRADLVVCPIDCISHSAIECVKRECQKLNKHFIPLRRSSLSAFAQALDKVGP
ncbi:MAG: hypothetical protein CL395_05370 [Acidiferrobacteraceae bacterium]|nr:hypothetical protein [Acidiferrobacteraceae bacterium]